MCEGVDISNRFCPKRHAGNRCEHSTEQNDDEYEKHDYKHRLLQGVGVVRYNDTQSGYSQNKNNRCYIEGNYTA